VRGATRTGRPSPTLRAVEMDVELLSRLRNGDEDAFVMLVARYQQPMLRLARSMVPNQAVAEEAVQDTWMGVVRGIDRFEGVRRSRPGCSEFLSTEHALPVLASIRTRPLSPSPSWTRIASTPRANGLIHSTGGWRKPRTASTPCAGCRSSKLPSMTSPSSASGGLVA